MPTCSITFQSRDSRSLGLYSYTSNSCSNSCDCVVALCGLRCDLARASYKMSMTQSRFDLKSLSPSHTPPICRIMTSGSSPKTVRESLHGGFVWRDIDFQTVTSRAALPALTRLATVARRISFAQDNMPHPCSPLPTTENSGTIELPSM